MADNKYRYPPAPPSGRGTFSDDLVGLQIVGAGGLTQGNFEFTTNVVEKVNRKFNLGVFSNPISLENLEVESIQKAKEIIAKDFRVYPNYDLSQITTFNLYGSLQKRMSASVTRIINFFPAAIEVNLRNYNLTTGYTATNILFDEVENATTFNVDITKFKNPFEIDYSANADRNISVRPMEVSPLRNLKKEFLKYALYVDDISTEYKFLDFTPTQTLSQGVVSITVEGNPFSGETNSVRNLVIKPNTFETDVTFKEAFDEVEDFLLNRLITPLYTAKFEIIRETNDGKFFKSYQKITWPLDGLWNIDIRTTNFDEYLESLNNFSLEIDRYKTNLISRFLTTGAFKDFDTPDKNVEKVLQLYGRSFDEAKKFIEALAYMNSVNYIVKNDIPSELLKNLAQTLGWDTNISPITNEGFLSSVFGNGSASAYEGQNRSLTPNEINFQYYRNLILNSAYLFKSKGTRKSIESLLRLIGAPKALIEINETIYLADGPINMTNFNEEYNSISGGTKIDIIPVLDPSVVFNVEGIQYTGFTTQSISNFVDVVRGDYPVDNKGYPKMVQPTEDYFFEKGGGWYEQTPQHRTPEEINVTNSVFTGQNPDIQTVLEPLTYGQKYFDRYENFPNMDLGFNLTRVYDNNKSWTNTETGLRRNVGGGYDAYYHVSNEKLVLNAKNLDLNLNMGRGIIYDIWDMSKKYNYPIPSTGLTSPYPYVTNTGVNPKPKEKSFFEFAQTFYRNMIDVRNRQGKSNSIRGAYPTLRALYQMYLNSEEAVNIPSNKYTYQKMIDFTNGMGDYWMKLVEQMIPATTIWTGGQKMENNVLQRQKVVWRRQRGCEFIIIPCIPCTYTGQLFGYDCVNQFVECNVNVSSFQEILNSSINYIVGLDGYQLSDCQTNTLESQWFVDIRLDDEVLAQRLFYIGYGGTDTPTNNTWYQGIESALQYLYQNGLYYTLNGDTLMISNIGCNNDFTDKTLQVNVGVYVNINCE
jgi:hypothetical protein